MVEGDVSVVGANEASCGELNVGSRNTFLGARSREVSRPTTRWVVMRLDLADA
ncbi:hypothetical protein ACQEVC_12815 [Plantactinospora sp. CA-294935]|uniref:hypothetical protein n=1 Tax=Plantactinospora sp. CA-294935 TaxID=3240012 RepID=UPI003D8CEF8B